MNSNARSIRSLALWGALLLSGARAAFAMGEVGTLTLPTGADKITTAVADSSRTFALFGTDTSPGQVHKVRLADFVITNTIATTATHLISGVVDSSNTYAYFASSTTPSRISKISLTTLTETDWLLLSAGEGYASSVFVDSTSLFAYFGTHTSPGVIAKVRLASFTEYDSLTLDPGESYLSCAVVDTANGFAYFGTNTAPGKIIKVNLATFAKTATLTLASGEDYLTSAVISTTTGMAYFGTNTTQGRVIQVRLSDFTKVTSLMLASGEGYLTSVVLDAMRGILYFGTNSSPGKIVRIPLASFIETFTSTLASGEDSLLGGIMDASTFFAYFGTGTSPGQIIKMDMLDTRTGPPLIVTQPSDADVNPGSGTTFSVAAVGTAPFTYQWQLNGVNIPGATSDSYTTGTVMFGDDNSNYTCVVTNSFGSATTRAAILTVIPVIKVYPNPWRSDVHGGVPLTFEGAAPNSTLKIYTLSMHWVKSETGGGSLPLTWNRTNDAGQRVASGYYFFLVSTPNGRQTVHGRFAIVQ